MTKPKYLVLDLETTGLDPIKDGILEVGAIAIDENYHSIGVYSAIIKPTLEQYERLFCDSVVCKMHDESGLTQATEHGLPLAHVDASLHAWLTCALGYSAKEVIIAGFSIAFDHSFIKQHMPLVGSLLSHRMLDFSVPLSLFQELGYSAKKPKLPHRALPDSLLELKAFQDLMREVAQDRADAEAYRVSLDHHAQLLLRKP